MASLHFNKKNPVVLVVAIGIGAALFFVLGRFVSIPSPIPNTSISIQYGLLAFMAAVFGPVAGALIGFIGHFLVDLSAGWGIWWSWVITSGVAGALMGFAANRVKLGSVPFGGKQIGFFNAYQAVAHLICWVVVAPILDILIYQEPANKVFVQGLVAAAANIVTTAIIGTLLCFAFSKAVPEEGSLKED